MIKFIYGDACVEMMKNKKRIIIACIALIAIVILGSIIYYVFIHKFNFRGCPLTMYEAAAGKVIPECMLINDTYFIQASYLDPITARDTTLDIGKQKTLKIGFYCKGPYDCKNARPAIKYIAGYVNNNLLLFNQSSLNESGLTFTSSETDVKANQDTIFESTISSSESMTAGGYIVLIEVDDQTSPGQDWAQEKQIVLTIR